MSGGAVDPPSALNLGLYGKLPARGDFVTRFFNRDFTQPWDEWLGRLMLKGQEFLGENWLPLYLSGPIWRFALAPGVCGTRAVAGVLMPSVDQVGRFFPLTLGVEIDEFEPTAFAILNQSWFAAIEEQALAMLDPNYDLTGFDGSPRPQLSPGRHAPDTGAPTRYPIPNPEDVAAALWACAGSATVWWTLGADAVTPSLLASPRLPDARMALAFFDGDWTGAGWVATGTPTGKVPELDWGPADDQPPVSEDAAPPWDR